MTSLGRLFRTRGSRNKTEDTEKEMGFFEHLEEFRAMLVRCIGAFALSMILTFCFLKPIFAFMRGPLDQALARNPKPPAPDGTGADPIELVSALTNILLNGKLPTATHAVVSDSATATAATGASAIDALTTATQATAAGGPMVVMKFMDIFSIIMNIGLIGAIVLSGPCILWFGSRFIAPALTEGEKKCIIPFCVGSTLLFISGGVFSFFWLIPTSIQVMFHFVRMFGLTMPWLASDYYNFVTIMVLLVGLAFQFPLIVIVLQYLEIVQTKTLFRLWRHVLVGILVTSLVISPISDPISLCVLTGVLFLLYIGAAGIGGVLVRRKQKKRAEEEAEYERTYGHPRNPPALATDDTDSTPDVDGTDYYGGGDYGTDDPESDGTTSEGDGTETSYDGEPDETSDPDSARALDGDEETPPAADATDVADGTDAVDVATEADAPPSPDATEPTPPSEPSPAPDIPPSPPQPPAPIPSPKSKGDLAVIE